MVIDFAGRGRLSRLMDEQEEAGNNATNRGSANAPSSYNLSPELTIDKYFLGGSPPNTQDLFMFLSRYEEHNRKERVGTMLLAKFISIDYLRVLESEIYRHRRGRFRSEYTTLLKSNGRIFEAGKQMLTNSVLTDVITYVASPKTRSKTLRMLRRSVFPAKHWGKFQKVEYLKSHLDQYLYDWIAYRTRFELLLDLLRHAKDFLPTFVLRKEKQHGLLDYMIKCSPNPKYMYGILQEGREGQIKGKISDRDSWDVINVKLIDILRRWVDMQENAEDANQRMLGYNRDEDMLPPVEVEIGLRRAERDREGLHAVVDYRQDSDEDEEATWDPPQEYEPAEGDPEVGESGGYKTAPEDQPESHVEKQLRVHEDGQLDQLNEETLFREEVLMKLDSVVNPGRGVCWSFADTGKCALEGTGKPCRFSHEPADVEHYKALKLLGPSRLKEAHARVQLRLGPGRVGSATSPGPRSTSPGVRPPFRDGKTPATSGRRSSYPPKKY